MTAPARETPPRVLELIALYRRTHYGVVLPDASQATLRVGEAAPPAVVEWIGAAGFAIYLTACNPCSMALTHEQNDERLTQLRQRLRADGARWLEGRAGIPGEPWCEPSLLVAGVSLAHGDALADRFEQNATVVVDAASPVRLRIRREDWRVHLDATPYIVH
ncbi:MAG TPA: DUF3293 domain-containing protein [Dokdonella sp.]